MAKKPSIHTGPASQYAGPNETIREFSDGAGKGGLIALRKLDDGTLQVELYRLDAGVRVTTPPMSSAQRGEAFTQSEEYAAGRMTHGIITRQDFGQVQSEVVHDALMAAFQAGYLAAAAGESVDSLLSRMADLG